MCGIFGFTGKQKNIGALCFNALKQLEYRGYDSWGVAIYGENLEVVKKIGKLPMSYPEFKAGSMALGHTRWATHGGVTITNAHPHVGNNKRAVVAHNGIVENYLELKNVLEKSNCCFQSETDTEIIVQLYEKIRTSLDPLPSFIKTISQLSGNNAVVIMDLETKTLLATKNGSPMVIGKSNFGSFIASDVAPLLGHCDLIYYVENNEILVASETRVQIYDSLSSSYKEPDWIKPDMTLSQVELGSYPHYLIKEICEQPEILRNISLSKAPELKSMRHFISSGSDLWFTGCGTAFYACLLATYIAARKGITARAVYAHELPMLLGQLNNNSRVIALSQSGETIDVIDAITMAKAKNIKTGALVNVTTSSLSRIVDCSLPVHAGPEICVLSTKAFTAMVSNLFALFETDYSIASSLLKAANAIEYMLKDDTLSEIDDIAHFLCMKQSIFIVGTGEYYPLAMEAALKIKEVSYIHAEAFPSGELKHGVIALIEEGTPCIVFAPDNNTEEKNGDNSNRNDSRERIKIHASEIRARGGKIISLSPKKLSPEDVHIKVDFDGIAYFFAALAAIQLLAYKCALIKNLDPDKPRNLAKSVTVR
ncbi:MAG TPA: glutamine--fructose-6-phosphate transaminase (isomerizing) [Oligoflexia bacterium]|nr:glutamine--fructose-6-phosphate transaminase (isomerizing) [Oligoflexia bacterium]HMP49055.1 glutamine--fructose-6-phosphate transaminase (isomerizing) [Oligoflexia bacterium]